MRREGEGVFRLQNVDVRELLELLSAVYQKADYTDIVLDFKAQKIAIEPPFDIDTQDFKSFVDRPEVEETDKTIDEVKMNDEIFRLLTKRK